MPDLGAPMPARHDHEHRHFRLDDSRYVTHAHEHRQHAEDGSDFNNLHHHAPREHAG